MKEKQLLLIVNTSTCCENGAPPDKFGLLQRLLLIESHGFDSMIDVCRVIRLWLLELTQFFTDSLRPLKCKICISVWHCGHSSSTNVFIYQY